MHDAALLAVHHRERKRPGLLVFAFLGQLNQLAEPVVDHLDQGLILFGVRPQELGIVGLQLGRQVRVADLQTDGQPPVTLQRATLVAALQRFVTLRLGRPEDVAQLDRSAPLHFLHRRRQLGRRDAAVLFAKIVTRSRLFPVAALARDFDRFPTGQIGRTFAIVARCLTLVRTVDSDCGASLAADFVFGGTGAAILVARFYALVAATRQWHGARKTTAEGTLVARDGFTLFVFAVAMLRRENHTRWTVRFGVAVVEDRMSATVLPRARLITGRFARPARHRWEDYGRTTFARQLVERNPMTGAAGTTVTRFVTAMPAASQRLRAGFRTNVVIIDTTFLVTLVLGAASHACATFLTASIVGSTLQLSAFHLLIHMTASTFDQGRFVTRRTFVQMASSRANVVCAGTSTSQLLSANGLTNRNRIQATFAFALHDGLLPARTRRDQLSRESTISTGTCVAQFGAVVILTIQRSAANLLAAKPCIVQIGHRTGDLLLLLSTVTLMFQALFTLCATVGVTLLLAGVNSAIQRLPTGRFTYDVVFLAALHRLRGSSTATTALDHRLTGWTRSRVAQKRARMVAQFLSPAQFPTGVSHVASVILGILLLAAEAIIFPGNLFGYVLTSRASPTVVRERRVCPLGGTVQM